MKIRPKLALLGTVLALSACASTGGDYGGFSDYSAVRVQRVKVGDGSLYVSAPRPWNRHRPILFEDIRDVEDWTLNGPLLDGMSFELRSVFVAYEIDEMSMRDIAGTLGIPVNTAYSRLRLARDAFAEACRDLRARESL